MRVLDLFSGIGGFSLGLERAGMETVAFCEIDSYARAVLRKHWPDVPIFEDVRKLTANDVENVELICGGYPCQGESYAGERRGAEDDRWLWPEFARLVEELRPAWIVGENVAGHVTLGLDTVLSDLEALGYASQTFIIPAVALDAAHRRDRVFVVGNASFRHGRRHSARLRRAVGRNALGSSGRREKTDPINRSSKNVPDSSGSRRPFGLSKARPENTGVQQGAAGQLNDDCDRPRGRTELDYWPIEPALGRVANGIPNRVDRLRCLGNAVVPQIVEEIGRAIMSAHHSSVEAA